MKVSLIPALLILLPGFSAWAQDSESHSVVGVLMDAQCQAIVGASRHAEPAPVVAAKRRTPAKEGIRGRSTAPRRTDEPDRYEGCKATVQTAAFAIHTDGQLLVLDDDGNEVIRQQMRNDSFRAAMSDETGSPRWLTVMVDGRKAGERLTITSVRR